SGKTLGELARSRYPDAKYWRLLAAINKDRGYYKLSEASAQTPVKGGSLVEIWQVSKYFGKDVETTVRIASRDKRKGYEEMLALAEQGKRFPEDVSPDQLSDYFKQMELSFAYGPAQVPSDVSTLGELSLKYYGEKKYWPLFVWVNRKAFDGSAAGVDAKVPRDKGLFVVHFVP